MVVVCENIFKTFNYKLQNLFKSPDYPANVYLFKVKDEITNYLKLRNHNPSWKKNLCQCQTNQYLNLLPAGNYMFKVNNRNTRTRCEICSKLTIKTAERRHWRRSGVFIVNFEHISHLCSSVSFVNFEHVIAGWACIFIIHCSYRHHKCFISASISLRVVNVFGYYYMSKGN